MDAIESVEPNGAKKINKNKNKLRFKKNKEKRKCIVRESNTGLVDGNDEFYH